MNIHTVHGVQLLAEYDKVIEDYTRRGLPTFEPESVAAWKAVVRPGTVAIDVGAYTGLYAILAAQAGAWVHALEPNPDVFGRLRENVKLNQVTVRAYRAAAGRTIGAGSLVTKRTPLTSASRVQFGEGAVSVMPLDDLQLQGAVSAIKVDVEGAELDVLDGARRIIAMDHPLIIVEANSTEERVERESYLRARGYRTQFVDSRNIIAS